MKHLTVAVLLAAATVGCKTAEPAPDPEPVEEVTAVEEPAPAADPLQEAIDSPTRPDAQRARDAYRNPYDTLKFFEVTPTSTVLELWAGGGWYTGILAPYVAGTGTLYVTAYPDDTGSEYLAKMTASFKSWLKTAPNGSNVNIIEVNPPEVLDFGLQDEVDVVLTFRNVHNWAKNGYDTKIYEQAFKALKSGGTFGLVDHRAPEGMSEEDQAKSGYIAQERVVAAVESVGFELVESSEINANPNDTKDHPEGVWTLPPSLRLGDVDRDKYVAIGESDRMTLKFRKP